MGFELLPIEEGNENKYNVITITSPSRWTPQKFVSEASNKPYFYDPTDAISNEELEYPAFANHAAQELDEQSPNEIGDISIVDPYQPLLETQAYVATADDQAKQILARSVVRPFHQSQRVKWDPALDVKQDKVTAKSTEEAIPGTLVAVSDDSGEDVIVVEEHPRSPEEDSSYENQGLDTKTLSFPASGVTTRSKGKLMLDNTPLTIDEEINTFPRIKKQSYKDVEYQSDYAPEEAKEENRKLPPRRSERLKKSTIWAPSKVTKALLGSTSNILLLPSSLQALPSFKLLDDPWQHIPGLGELSNKDEALRAYHAKLDLWQQVQNPEQDDYDWQIEKIEDWELRKSKSGQKVYLKVTWIGGGTNSGFLWMLSDYMILFY
jgi:hypothetical protein